MFDRMRPAMVALWLVAVTLVTACSPAATAPTPSVAPSASSAVTASATVASSPSVRPTAAPTAIPLPTGAQVAAAGGGVVWMYVNGDHLFRSLDRGDTWTERTLPSTTPTAHQVAFISDRVGWFVETSVAAGDCATQTVTMWTTADGAATWQRVDASGIAQRQCKSGFVFNDAQRGYFAAWDSSAAPVIYRTVDAGKTWAASAPLADAPGFTTRAGTATLRPDVVADFGDVLFVDILGFNDSSRYYAYRSTDRGVTWSYAATGPEQGAPIIFVTATRWLQIVAPTSSRETTDAGKTWHTYATDYQQAAPVAPQIVFGDANTGYATVRGGLQRTIDGGAHWTALHTPGT